MSPSNIVQKPRNTGNVLRDDGMRPQNVTLHLRDIFNQGALQGSTTCKDYLQVRQEGSREVTRKLRH